MSFSAVMITRRCNMSCGHCSVESHPGIPSQPTRENLIAVLHELSGAGVRAVQFTGGEPLIRKTLLLELMRLAGSLGMRTLIISNGFWGRTPEKAASTLLELRDAGLVRLAISYDRFHADFMGPEPVLNILRAARKHDFPVHLNITRTADDSDLTTLLQPFLKEPNALFRIYDVQPVGKARELKEPLREELEGFCSGCEQPTVTDDGRLLACNGPAYFENEDSPLNLGPIGNGSTLSQLLERHDTDPILEVIRLSGPMELRRLLESGPAVEGFRFKSHYSGMCELCRHINGTPRAVEALRSHLERPEVQAELKARSLVKRAARGDLWHRDGINSRGAAQGFFLALVGREGEHARTLQQVLGRADLDWCAQARRLKVNGLGHRLLARRSGLARFAPDFFWRLLDEDGHRAEPGFGDPYQEWKRDGFGKVLKFAVGVHERPEAGEGRLRRVGQAVLRYGGLLLPESDANSAAGAVEQVAITLACSVAFKQEHERLNLFFRPLLHLLLVENWGDLLPSLHAAARAFLEEARECRRMAGGEELVRLLKNDFAVTFRAGLSRLRNLWGVREPGKREGKLSL